MIFHWRICGLSSLFNSLKWDRDIEFALFKLFFTNWITNHSIINFIEGVNDFNLIAKLFFIDLYHQILVWWVSSIFIFKTPRRLQGFTVHNLSLWRIKLMKTDTVMPFNLRPNVSQDNGLWKLIHWNDEVFVSLADNFQFILESVGDVCQLLRWEAIVKIAYLCYLKFFLVEFRITLQALLNVLL